MPVLSSQLLDKAGRPISGASVTAYDAASVIADTTTTDPTGAWSLTLAGGTFTLVYQIGSDWVADPLIVCADDADGDIRQHTVFDQLMQPVSSALVWIRDGDGNLVDFGADNPVVTDWRGRWYPDLPFGTYYLAIVKAGVTIFRTLAVCTGATATRYIIDSDGDIITGADGSRLTWN